jgi:hypothetical protein
MVILWRVAGQSNTWTACHQQGMKNISNNTNTTGRVAPLRRPTTQTRENQTKITVLGVINMDLTE